MPRFNFFAIATATLGLAAAVSASGPLNVTVASLPSGSNIQGGVNAPYTSHNAPVLWLLGESNNYYAWDANRHGFLSSNPLAQFTANNNHIDQLYYDRSTNTIVAYMELDHAAGIGTYYINGYNADSVEQQWGNTAIVAGYPGTQSGLPGVQNGAVVAINSTGAFAQSTAVGNILYYLPDVAQARCNQNSLCVGIDNNGTMFGFHADTGAIAWTNPSAPSTGVTLAQISGRFMVFTTANHYYSVDCASGAVIKIAPISPTLHHRGPNLVAQNPTTGDVVAYRIADGRVILRASGQTAGGNATYHWANQQAIIMTFNDPSTSTFMVAFYDSAHGQHYGTYGPFSDPGSNAPSYGQSPFLVGSSFVYMTSASSYNVVSKHGDVQAQSDGASQFATDNGNIVYTDRATLMWSVPSVLQFDATP